MKNGRLDLLGDALRILITERATDSQAYEILSLMADFKRKQKRSHDALMRVPGFKKIWIGIAKGVDVAICDKPVWRAK